MSGIALKEQKKSKIIDNESVSTYLSKIDGSFTIANSIYHGCLSIFDMSFLSLFNLLISIVFSV